MRKGHYKLKFNSILTDRVIRIISQNYMAEDTNNWGDRYFEPCILEDDIANFARGIEHYVVRKINRKRI